MTKAENVLFSGFFFALYWSLFGLSVNSPLTFNLIINQLTAGPPAQNIASTTCSAGDITCATVAIANAIFAYAGYFFSIVAWFLLKFTWFSAFIATLVLGPQQAAQATPFISLFWGALFIYVGFEVIRIFRGNSTAGV